MNELVRQWLVEVLSYNAQNVIRANQEGPIPSGNFATYQIINVVPSIHSIVDEADGGSEALTTTYYNRGMATVQVNLYDSSGWDKQHKLAQSGYLLSVRQIFQPSYVSLIRSGSIVDATELIDTKYKSRFTCDHDFYLWNTLIESDEQANGYIITGQYQPGDEEVVIDVTP